MNRLGETELDSWWEQFLARLYLPLGQTSGYYSPLPLETGC